VTATKHGLESLSGLHGGDESAALALELEATPGLIASWQKWPGPAVTCAARDCRPGLLLDQL